MRRPLAALAIATVASLLFAPGAAGEGFDSRVTIHLRGEAKGSARTFYGRVVSERGACERRRTVVLFGQSSGAPAERVDRDRTNDRGRWRIRHVVGYRTYYAEVKRSRVNAGACRSDLSKPLSVG